MKIKNFSRLAVTRERAALLNIINAALEDADTERVVSRNVSVKNKNVFIAGEKIALEKNGRIFIVAIGKCALAAARALEQVLGGRISGGIVLDVRAGRLRKMKSYAGDHPVPSERNIAATKEIISLLKNTKENDVVIFIISGGGSALLAQPEGLTIFDEVQIYRYLTRHGADIKEMNTVRKHTSLARGGFLAAYAYPSRSYSLIFSDVPGDEIGFVASGPTVLDTTTVADAENVLRKLRAVKKRGLEHVRFTETPKDKKYFKRVKNILVFSVRHALRAAAQKARELGFSPKIRSYSFHGEAQKLGARFMRELHNASAGTALLYGGESTVTMPESFMVRHGKGGRNMELALSALRYIRRGEALAAVATDGRDNTNFGGAIADMFTKEKAKKLGARAGEYLLRHSSYDFWSAVGDYLLLGDTGSNASDIVVALRI